MNTIFDKIYIVSLISNSNRRKFIDKQFQDLGIDFEYIYGVDFHNLKTDASGNPIQYPDVFYQYRNSNPDRDFGCALTHYMAIRQAYEFRYDKILIIEDDICLLKNKELIEYYLNNIPHDADYVSWDPRFSSEYEYNKFIEELKNDNEPFIKFSSDYMFLIGGMMYGLMNRKTIEFYVQHQHKSFHMSDNIIGVNEGSNNLIQRYVSSQCICTDQFNIQNDFNIRDTYGNLFYFNIYNDVQHLNKEDFYYPDNFSTHTRLYNIYI